MASPIANKSSNGKEIIVNEIREAISRNYAHFQLTYMFLGLSRSMLNKEWRRKKTVCLIVPDRWSPMTDTISIGESMCDYICKLRPNYALIVDAGDLERSKYVSCHEMNNRMFQHTNEQTADWSKTFGDLDLLWFSSIANQNGIFSQCFACWML